MWCFFALTNPTAVAEKTTTLGPALPILDVPLEVDGSKVSNWVTTPTYPIYPVILRILDILGFFNAPHLAGQYIIPGSLAPPISQGSYLYERWNNPLILTIDP